MSEGSVPRASSPAPAPAPAAPLPDDDDLLREFLLRLPPLPSSLPRASLVCKRWRRILSDPQFLRRFIAFHRRQDLPLLGFFTCRSYGPCFTPTLNPPDMIPSVRLSLPPPRNEQWGLLGCRHGLVLLLSHTRMELTVWDPVSGDQRRVAVPPELFSNKMPSKYVCNGALLCNGGHAGRVPLQAFKVVLLRTDDWLEDGDQRAFASLYDSETGVWGNLISTCIKAPLSYEPSILVGNSLCWMLDGYEESGILEFDLDRHSLAVIDLPPVGAEVIDSSFFQILRMEDSHIGLAIMSGESIHLWERKAGFGGVDRWMLQKTIELAKLLSFTSPVERSQLQGYDEDGHVIFVWTAIGVFMIDLKSMQFKNLFKSNLLIPYCPYRSLYTSGMRIGSDDVEAEALNDI